MNDEYLIDLAKRVEALQNEIARINRIQLGLFLLSLAMLLKIS